eukprot:4249365-Pyramimonas_sp.AAC.1
MVFCIAASSAPAGMRPNRCSKLWAACTASGGGRTGAKSGSPRSSSSEAAFPGSPSSSSSLPRLLIPPMSQAGGADLD